MFLFSDFFIILIFHYVNPTTLHKTCADLLDMDEMKTSLGNYENNANINEKLEDRIKQLKVVNSYLKYKIENYANTINSCSNLVNNNSSIIKCPQPTIYKSCAVAIKNGPGAYLVQPSYLNLPPFMVYCGEDPHGDAPWIFIQRRTEKYLNFKRKWWEYERGFGNLYGNFWFGLSKIHALTMSQRYELWIELKDNNNVVKHGYYNFFAVGNKEMLYNLHALGNFSGNIIDALRVHQGYKFSTQDKNTEDITCKQRLEGGGWWFTETCGDSQLNSVYGVNGLATSSWLGSKSSLVYVHMAIREYEPYY